MTTPSVAYLILAHEAPTELGELIATLLHADPSCHVVIHYDANAGKDRFTKLTGDFADNANVHFVRDRAACGWGEFGLVDGVVRALRLIRDNRIACDHIYLMSGSCLPLKPIAELKSYLAQNANMEFIEVRSESWIVGGLRKERYQYRHFVNERDRKFYFDLGWKTQRFFGLARRFPDNLAPRFGSQWWCLTRSTCMAVLDYVDKKPSVYRFFKSTWIPDELFFQTMVNHLVDRNRISDRNLTYFKFSDKGKPVVFFDDHLGSLDELPYFFIRKISPTASRLRKHLKERAAQSSPESLPKIGRPSPSFDYEKRVARQIEFPRPGQLYYGWQRYGNEVGWPAAMDAVRRPFVALYGPPPLTKAVRDALDGAAGVEALGRIFHPGKVDFGNDRAEFKGLDASDVAIRDYDPPLYLSRVLSRSDGLPLFEISPGENLPFEAALPQLGSAITLTCAPQNWDAPDWMRLFWALCVLTSDSARKADDEPAPRREDAFFPSARKALDQRLDRLVSDEHREFVRRCFLVSRERTRMPLYWLSSPPAEEKRRRTRIPERPDALIEEFEESSIQELGEGLIEEFGIEASPLVSQFPTIQAALSKLKLEQVLQPLPRRWQAFFHDALAPLSPAARANRTRDEIFASERAKAGGE